MVLDFWISMRRSRDPVVPDAGAGDIMPRHAHFGFTSSVLA
ncbi:Hypothetical protein A7982_03924 [Minicystis rosea]|nr:Hypothetical protein A7982_03924 [Minicystis rosea]